MRGLFFSVGFYTVPGEDLAYSDRDSYTKYKRQVNAQRAV